MAAVPHQPFEFTESTPDDSLVPIHPALDIVDGVLYVTVLAHVKGTGLQHVVLTSDGDIFSQDDFKRVADERGGCSRVPR
jgi:hypothetical protein